MIQWCHRCPLGGAPIPTDGSLQSHLNDCHGGDHDVPPDDDHLPAAESADDNGGPDWTRALDRVVPQQQEPARKPASATRPVPVKPYVVKKIPVPEVPVPERTVVSRSGQVSGRFNKGLRDGR